MTTVTFHPEPAANPEAAPSRHQAVPFGMPTSFVLLRHETHLQELTTGFLFGPYPCVPAKKAPPAAHLSLGHDEAYAVPVEAAFCWQSLFTAISTSIFRLLPARLLPPTRPPRLVLLLSLPQHPQKAGSLGWEGLPAGTGTPIPVPSPGTSSSSHPPALSALLVTKSPQGQNVPWVVQGTNQPLGSGWKMMRQ